MRVAWAVVGSGVASALALLGACGVDTSGTCVACGSDGAGLDATGGSDATGQDVSDGATDADATLEVGVGDVDGGASDCAVVKLPTKQGGIVPCGDASCMTPVDTCCPGTSTCPPQGDPNTECDGGLYIECEVNGDCGGQECCLQTTSLKIDPVCGTPFSTSFIGTYCNPGPCTAPDIQACEKQSDCPLGICTAFTALGRVWGGCI